MVEGSAPQLAFCKFGEVGAEFCSMGDCKVMEVRRPAGGEVETVTAIGMGEGDDVTSGIIAGTVAGDVAIRDQETGWNFEKYVLAFMVVKKGCKKCDDSGGCFARAKCFGCGVF